MAISYAIGPNPKWYFVNKNGKPLSGGYFNTYRSLDKSARKNVFYDNNGQFPLPNPAIIDADGTLGPIFFEIDPTNPNESYYIVVEEPLGQQIWAIDHYLPLAGNAGGSTVVALDLENLITNDVFYRHTDTLNSVGTYNIVAPSNNAGLVANHTTGTDVPDPSPDIVFLKDNTSSTDVIQFVPFTLGFQLNGSDSTPVDYFNFVCSGAGTETVKTLQFPITSKVQNLSNMTVSGLFWGRSSSLSTVSIDVFQYYGDGASAHAPVITKGIATQALTNSWVQYNFSFVIPNVTGNNLGGPQYGGNLHDQFEGPNDGLFLRFTMPNTTCSIDLTKIRLYLGSVPSNVDYHSYDQINSIISLPRTGDVRTSLNAFAPNGWVLCNDGVIANGNPALAAPAGILISRNNEDTYPLYSLLWPIGKANAAYLPIYTSAGANTTYGATAIADYSASKSLSLTKMLGRALVSAGQPMNITAGVPTLFGVNHNISENNIGEQTHLQTQSEVGPHVHPGNPGFSFLENQGGAGAFNVLTQAGADNQLFPNTGLNTATAPPVAQTEFNVMQPSAFFNVFLKL